VDGFNVDSCFFDSGYFRCEDASVGNLYNFFTDPEMNAQPVPVIFFDASV